MDRVARKGKNCCVENELTPSSFDVDVLRNVFAARLAVCMLTVFAHTGSRVPVVVAHTTQLRDLLFGIRCLCSRLFGTFFYYGSKNVEKTKSCCLPSSQPTQRRPRKYPNQPAPSVFVPIILPCQRDQYLPRGTGFRAMPPPTPHIQLLAG